MGGGNKSCESCEEEAGKPIHLKFPLKLQYRSLKFKVSIKRKKKPSKPIYLKFPLKLQYRSLKLKEKREEGGQTNLFEILTQVALSKFKVSIKNRRGRRSKKSL